MVLDLEYVKGFVSRCLADHHLIINVDICLVLGLMLDITDHLSSDLAFNIDDGCDASSSILLVPKLCVFVKSV